MPARAWSYAYRAVGALVAAIVWPLPTPFGSVLALDEAEGTRAVRAVHITCLTLFPVLFVAFGAVLVADRARYRALLLEDGPVEWATVAALVVAAVLAAANAGSLPRASRMRWLYLGLAGLCAFVVLEEISWGQRIFGIENPAFFVAYSDQKEINVHNVVQKVTHVAMKWPVGLGYVAYGALLPMALAGAGRGTIPLVPPLSLVRGFLLAALLMLDLPTSREEELAELFGALALALLLLAEWARQRSRLRGAVGLRVD